MSVTKALLVAIAIPFVIEIVVGGPQALFDPSAKLLFDLGAMQPIAVAGASSGGCSRRCSSTRVYCTWP